MTISDAQFTDWLKSQSAKRCVLVEIVVGSAGGGNVTRYLSNKAFTTSPADTPANTSYQARITGGIPFSQKINLDGTVSLSFGDIELDNTDGMLDAWLYDYWANRSFTMYIGDVEWSRTDFRPVFYGVTIGIDSRARSTLNIKISDKTQRLNTPLSATKLGGATALDDTILPTAFGEVHNVSLLSLNASTNTYIVHDVNFTQFERVIEIRDNGIPVSGSVNPSLGTATLAATPAGAVTASVQGAKIHANLKLASDHFINDISTSHLYSVPFQTPGIVPPYPEASVNSIVPDNQMGTHSIYSTVAGVANAVHTFSVMVKTNYSKSALLQAYVNDSTVTSVVNVTVDLTTGSIQEGDRSGFNSVGGVFYGSNAVSLGEVGGRFGSLL